jgi:hypothetical protein
MNIVCKKIVVHVLSKIFNDKVVKNIKMRPKVKDCLDKTENN